MKIRVTLSLEVDPKIWDDLYSVELPDEIRLDVKSYIANDVQSSAAADAGAIKVVRVS